MRRALLILLAACAGVGAGPADAGAARAVRDPTPCVRPGETATRTTARLVVVQRRGQERADRVCVRRTGERFSVGTSGGSTSPPARIDVAGWIVASSTSLCSDGRYDEEVSCEPAVERLDLRHRPQAELDLAAAEVTDVLACPGGRVLYLTRGVGESAETAVHVAFGGTLTRGADLDPEGLRRAGGRARWLTTDGTPAGSARCR